jgi:hypothetical protein
MATDDFFHSRQDQMIDLRHPLAALAERIPWSQLEATLALCIPRKLDTHSTPNWTVIPEQTGQSERSDAG